MVDVTNTSQSELDLLQAEEFFEKNPFAYFVVRAGGTIVRVNTRFAEHTGFVTADVNGKQIEDLLSRREVQELYGYHREKLRYRDRTFEYECNLSRKDGSEIRAVITMNIVVKGNFCLGALRDVTEERRLSAELLRSNEELNRSATRLREAQEELNRATLLATVGEVSGRVAHEILNPLTAVSAKVRRLETEDATLSELAGFLSDTASAVGALAGGDEPKETLQAVREALEEYRTTGSKDLAFISTELQRIQRLVDDMRGATKSAAARVDLSVHELLQYCTEVMSEPLQRGHASCSIACPPDIVVQADRGELIQVFTNLIRNSIEALSDYPEGKERSLGLTAVVREGVVDVRVTDNGPGIPAEIAPLIWEPSFTTKHSGTGLGLPIARRLIRAYGGDVQLELVEGRTGACFLVTLPCRVQQAAGWEG